MIRQPLVERLHEQRTEIETWFQTQWHKVPPPFYSSVDLRHSGFKLAPVDVNLYPAGFNNLSITDQNYAATKTQQLLHQHHNGCKNILIIAENHTRNLYYLEHLACLKSVLHKAGFVVKLSMITPTQQILTTLSRQHLSIEIATKRDGYLHIGEFIPDCIILNNDLSEGLPELLSSIHQPILPPAELGWYQRKKSHYFQCYNTISQQFSSALGLDSWLINPLFAHCDTVDFTNPVDQENLIELAEDLLSKINEKYRFYRCNQTPYLILKTNAGSYGMGVLPIKNAGDIAHLSRKKRQHMTKTKGNIAIQSVILQEGIPTITHWDHTVAEPVIYLVGSETIGGFYRTHPKRDAHANLNTPGMHFMPFKLHDSTNKAQNSLLYAYQLIARLSTLAAAYEIEDFTQKT